MTDWKRRPYAAPGLTQMPMGPYVDALARRLARVNRPPSPLGHAIGLYSPWAGTNRMAGAPADAYGNAAGAEYDLIADASVAGARVAVLNLCSIGLTNPTATLERKGFTFLELPLEVTQDGRRLSEILEDAAELWLISDWRQHLAPAAIDAIAAFFHSGRGLYIWGDNAPYFADANVLLGKLFGVAMSGNSPGDEVVTVCDENQNVGLISGHLITTGLVNIYEGITIAEVPTTPLLKPLIYGSNGRVVAAYFDEGGCRAIVDGGFTRLYNKWESAGTDRYIVNASAWLLNMERFQNATHS